MLVLKKILFQRWLISKKNFFFLVAYHLNSIVSMHGEIEGNATFSSTKANQARGTKYGSLETSHLL